MGARRAIRFGALRAIPIRIRTSCWPRCAISLAAMRSKRPRKSEAPNMSRGKNAVLDAVEPAKKSSISPADPCTIVIFGASGDLSRRKLVPALYGLAAQNCLARRFAIIGFARTPMTCQAFQQSAVDSVKKFANADTPPEEG